MTAEVATCIDRRKFIPLLKDSSWSMSAPSWLRGSYFIDLRGAPFSEENYIDLLNSILDRREKTPVVKNKSKILIKHDEESFNIPSPVMDYMRVRAWLAGQKSKYPIARLIL